MKKLRAGGIAVLAVTVGLGLAGCGSDEKKVEATTSSSKSSSSSASAAPPSPDAAKPNLTIPDYIKQNGIKESPVKRGDPGSPAINLPFPPGWEDMGPEAPEWAWGGIKFIGDPAMAASAADDHRPALEAAGQRRPRQDPRVRTGRDEEPARL